MVRPEFIHGVEDYVDALDTQIVADSSHFIADDVTGGTRVSSSILPGLTPPMRRTIGLCWPLGETLRRGLPPVYSA
jgi:hypothetical protein